MGIKELKVWLWNLRISLLIKVMPLRYWWYVRKARMKENIKIVFLIQLASSWKYDYLYRLFLEDKQYDPIIVVVPVADYDNVTMHNEMELAIDFFTKNGYKVVKSWNEEHKQWINIKSELNPDIVFFSNPWPSMSRPEYYIYNFLDRLTCYVPYGFKSSHLYQDIFNKPFQNLLWKIFYETEFHLEMAKKWSNNKGMNGVVTGYPGMDNLLDPNYQPHYVWKQNKKVKKVIWSPHHSIFGQHDSKVGFSTFLRYSDYMLKLALKYQDFIQVSFKPHPLLRSKLNKHDNWGKRRTDEYYEKWKNLSNGQVNEGNYIDLFLRSDAIINDGESFLIEYLYTGKPAMFLIADDKVTDRLNDFGNFAFKHLYHGKSEDDIEEYLKSVIINGKDWKINERQEFFEKEVKPPGSRLASENIFHFINNKINLQN